MMKILPFVLFCFLGPLLIRAQDSNEEVSTRDRTPAIREKIVVLATKSDVTLDELGGSAIVISADDIQRHQWRNLADVLQSLPGISLVRTGGEGAVTTVFVRGANAENTLVLVNGIRVNDPSAPKRGFDFGHWSTSGIERIEYLPTSQSTLYGSDASSGVINIVTKQGGSEPRWSAAVEAGSGGNSDANFFGGGSIADRFSFGLGLQNKTSQSISAGFDPRTNTTPSEEDGYENTNGQAHFDYQADGLRAGISLQYLAGDLDIDKFPFNETTFAQDFADDPNYRNRQRQTSWRGHFESDQMEGRWRQSLEVGLSRIDREDRDGPDEFTPFPATGKFSGENRQAEWRHNLRFSEAVKAVAGIGYTEERDLEQDRSSDTQSLFAQVQLALGNFQAQAGGRRDSHSDFGAKTTFRFAPVYHIPNTDTKLYGSVGTGFRSPALFELHDGFSGNPNLNPEESESWELGVVQGFFDNRLDIRATYYESKYDNLIDFSFATFAYINRPEARMSGIELSVGVRVGGVNARLAFENLYQAHRRGSAAEPWSPLVRRADEKASLRLDGRVRGRFDWFLDTLYYGESLDHNFFTNEFFVVLDTYLLINLGVTARINDAIAINLRGENLFDEEYTQVIGYGVYGARGFLGLTYRR